MNRLIKKLLILFIPIVILLGIIIIVDPYFHYHKPISGISYILNNERYQNKGILRYFDYDTIITGNSQNQNLKTSEVDKLFGVKSIKTTYMGAYLPEITAGLKQSYDSGHEPKIIMMSLAHYQFNAEKDYWGHEDFDYPYYMYDDNVFNDWKYLFNLVILNEAFRSMVNTVRGIPMTSFDEYSNLDKEAVFGKTTVLNLYRRSKLHSENIFKDKDKIIIKENILENIISLAKEKKNTKFYLYFTPYSVLYWDDLIRRGDLDRTLKTLKIVIKDLLEVDNIRLYYFSNNTEITTNFDNYKDTVHYGEWVNSYIIKAISKGENLLTKDNYMDYLNKTREIYTNYDYKSLLNSNY